MRPEIIDMQIRQGHVLQKDTGGSIYRDQSVTA